MGTAELQPPPMQIKSRAISKIRDRTPNPALWTQRRFPFQLALLSQRNGSSPVTRKWTREDSVRSESRFQEKRSNSETGFGERPVPRRNYTEKGKIRSSRYLP